MSKWVGVILDPSGKTMDILEEERAKKFEGMFHVTWCEEGEDLEEYIADHEEHGWIVFDYRKPSGD
ncbi:MAG: hypothetical protein H0Z34_15520 [Brevibacillus sp.]|nr:hypothetical protein [Brevibacillus sp.]